MEPQSPIRETQYSPMSPTSKLASQIAPTSPFYNALVSAYQDRKGNRVQLVPIAVGSKGANKKTVTISEQKRHRKEEIARRSVNRDKWWVHEPNLPGIECTPHQTFLADSVDNYTGVYKKRFTEPKGGTAVTGDYHTTPRKASTMLMNKSYAELNIPKRSADFRTEVTWRMKLRTQTPSDFQMAQYRRAQRAQQRALEKQANKRESVRHDVVDSVGNLLHFFAGAEEGGGRRELEEVRRIKEEAREREEMEERQREMLTAEIKKRAAFLLGPLGEHDGRP